MDNIDVFCEKGVFGLDDTRKILEAGKAIGLAVNFHGDELHPMKAAEVIELCSLPFFVSSFALLSGSEYCVRPDKRQTLDKSEG